MREALLRALGNRGERALELQSALTAFRACGPDNGGPGEWAKAAWLEDLFKKAGITDIEHVDAPDERAEQGLRPNLVVKLPGKSSKTLWIIGHLDVVPPGEEALWHSDPWTVTRDPADPDLIRGRGVEDNHSAIVPATLLALELAEMGLVPDLSLGLLLVADEETGNAYGMDYLLAKRPDLIKKDDLVLVPDFGSADGTLLEVAEKGVMWVKLTLSGKQCHASTPDEGVNSLLAAAAMITRLKSVQDAFGRRDDLFSPPYTTVTPTRHDANVPNVNTMPGKDVFYVDCRVLPCYSLDEVEQALRALGRDIEQEYGVGVELEVTHTEPLTPPTPVDSEVVKLLSAAVLSEYGIHCRPGGVGGSTVAAALRRLGVPVAVWSRVMPNFHQPNEATRLSYSLSDSKVFSRLLFH